MVNKQKKEPTPSSVDNNTQMLLFISMAIPTNEHILKMVVTSKPNRIPILRMIVGIIKQIIMAMAGSADKIIVELSGLNMVGFSSKASGMRTAFNPIEVDIRNAEMK